MLLFSYFGKVRVGFTEESVISSAGTSGRNSKYQDIERCFVCKETHRGSQFTVLKFVPKRGFTVFNPVKQVVLGGNAPLDSALELLRAKNVPVEIAENGARQ